ncbi:MAG: hypothetical protein J6J79_11535 [Lachnospiraceae bacterium]|nr:hypothetical protein [Lachnospiraceae bacterium]
MRIYLDDDRKELVSVICNRCKKELKVENGIVKEGCFHAEAKFGYFSKRDGVMHHFDLCEDCYDRMAAGFAIPVEEEEMKELL